MASPKKVRLETSAGALTIELDVERAPQSAANFLAYVQAGHYDGTVFHRVIKGFMVQGGGFEPGMKQKPTQAPIKNEANNGVKNKRYTLAMARTSDPHSATAQFFINTVDNAFLDFRAENSAGLGLRGLRPCRRGDRRRRPHRGGEHRPQGRSRKRARGGRAHRARHRGGLMPGEPRAPRAAPRRAAALPVLPWRRRAHWRRIDFISDLHLSEPTPATFAAFAAYLRYTDADAVFILGDLFELWVGDDARDEPFERRCVEVLAAAAAARACWAHGAATATSCIGGAD